MVDEISFKEGEKLVNSGEWIFRSDLFNYIEDQVEPFLRAILADKKVMAKALVEYEVPHEVDLEWNGDPNAPTKKSTYLPGYISAIHAVREVVEETAESKEVEAPRRAYNYNPLLQEFRMWDGKILKIGPTLNKTKWVGFSIIGAILSVASWNALAFIATGFTILSTDKDIIPALRSSWEHLSDPKEYTVFEAIAILQARYSVVVNFDAEKQKDYDRAYAKLAPRFKDIQDALVSHVVPGELQEDWQGKPMKEWEDDLLKTMNALKDRSILKERNGRWSIVF
jgi:hypothetical protein